MSQAELRNLVIRAPSPGAQLRDTHTILRTAQHITEDDRALAETNIAGAQSECALIDQEILHIQKNLDDLQRRTTVHRTGPVGNVACVQYEDAAIDQDISCIQQSLEKLKGRRNELRQFEELERALLSPIRRIPDEVLQKIFVLAHYFHDPAGRFYPHDSKSFARVATQVCSHWRVVARSYAPLWTRINFSTKVHQRVPEDNPIYGAIVEDCLELSNGMPLFLWFTNGVWPEILGDSCMQALGRNVYRWQHVVVYRGEQTKALFDSIPKDAILENLEALTLYDLYGTTTIQPAPQLSWLFLSSYPCIDPPDVPIVIESAPCLTRLSLECIPRPSTTITGLDWSLIRQFNVDNVDFEPGELNIMLGRMSNLTSLRLDGTSGTLNSTRITLDSLESLSIYSLEEARIFNMLSSPRLQRLEVGCDFADSEDSALANSLFNFAHRSKFRLKQLTVSAGDINDSWLIPEFTYLKTLSLESCGIRELTDRTWTTIKRLTPESSPLPNGIFPMLESLSVGNLRIPSQHEDSEWGISTLFDMLESRLRPHETGDVTTRSYLKHVSINFTSPLNDEDAKIRSEFIQSELVRNSGVNVNITERPLRGSLT